IFISCKKGSQSLTVLVFNYDKSNSCGHGNHEAVVVIGVPSEIISGFDTSIDKIDYCHLDENKIMGYLTSNNSEVFCLYRPLGLKKTNLLVNRDLTYYLMDNPVDTLSSLRSIGRMVSILLKMPYSIKLKDKDNHFIKLKEYKKFTIKYYFEDMETDTLSDVFDRVMKPIPPPEME
ncbi:MAG: hypothetical protein IT265_16455, partial [Saprospiraceae bacterium]|nr:hypothetical protein [Saprospiraceae bacterium]